MKNNKKAFARTKAGYFPPKFYHKGFKLSNSQEAALATFMLIITGLAIVGFLLLILELWYLNK